MGASSSSLEDEYNKLDEKLMSKVLNANNLNIEFMNSSLFKNIKKLYFQESPKTIIISNFNPILFMIFEKNTKLKPSDILYFLNTILIDLLKSKDGGNSIKFTPEELKDKILYLKFAVIARETQLHIYNELFANINQINKDILPFIKSSSGGKKKNTLNKK